MQRPWPVFHLLPTSLSTPTHAQLAFSSKNTHCDTCPNRALSALLAMAPKGKKAAGAGKRAGGVYKDDRVPDPAIATEGYAAVSLYRCSTVEAILVHPRFPVPQTLHAIPIPICSSSVGSASACQSPVRLPCSIDSSDAASCPFFKQRSICTATIRLDPTIHYAAKTTSFGQGKATLRS